MRNRKQSGFTMAEMLIVVAIVMVLLGVIAVSVAAYQRSMTRLEFDAIAKEIFVAAQNHLTEAEGQNYLGLDETVANFGAIDSTGEIPVRYIDKNNAGVLKQMLPDYALDETVRSGGTYVIRYQEHPAQVLDVFYSYPGRTGFLTVSGTSLSVSDYLTLMAENPGYREGKEKQRESYPSTRGGSNCVIGWYGGGEALPKGERLDTPVFEVHNEEQLYVKLSNASGYTGYKVVLVVEGKSSKAEKYFDVDLDNPSVLLDDVTAAGKHFAQIFSTADKGSFIPGEDLNIYAVAFSVDKITNVAKSPIQTTNSLFADPEPYTTNDVIGGSNIDADDPEHATNNVVGIANFRHLENLEEDISNVRISTATAAQTSDLDWTATWKDWEGHDASWSKIVTMGGTATSTGCFYPVSPNVKLDYLGNPPVKQSDDPSAPVEKETGRTIKNVKVDSSGPAGLFGTLPSGTSSIKDLELLDFDITGTDAGALIGTTNGTVNVTNVIAHNSISKDVKDAATIKGSANAGGLIGSMNGGTVDMCAAALVVSGSANAGGLIGATNGAEVMNSNSGGHTDLGEYYLHDANNDRTVPLYNVNGATAGGLIGSLSGGSVDNCYSTCSANATNAAGGLVGNASGTSVSNSYATGLVACMGKDDDNNDVNKGRTLIGSGSAATSGNYYLGSINFGLYVKDDSENVAGDSNAVSFSSSTAAYRDFFTEPTPADPYDRPGLTQSYVGKYPYVRWLNGSVSDSYYVGAFHYGDWPMETLFANTPKS